MRNAIFTAIVVAVGVAAIGLFAGFAAAEVAHGQTRSPALIYALVIPDAGKGGTIRVVGRANHLLAGTDATDSPTIQAETRNAAGDSFATYPPVHLYPHPTSECTRSMLIASKSCVHILPTTEIIDHSILWSIWLTSPSQAITPAEIRFGNGAGEWTDWFAVPLAPSLDGVPTPPNLLAALRGIHLAIARYDEYPRQPETPGSVAPPTTILKDRLRALPGGELTAIFLIPMIATGFCLTFTRSPALLLLICAGSMTAAVFLSGASPFALVFPLVLGVSGALIGIQFGYTRKFGG